MSAARARALAEVLGDVLEQDAAAAPPASRATGRASAPARVRWRRATVFTAATGLFSAGLISERAWVAVTLVFLAGEILERITEAITSRPLLVVPPPSSTPSP